MGFVSGLEEFKVRDSVLLVAGTLAALWLVARIISWVKFQQILNRCTGGKWKFPMGTIEEHGDFTTWYKYTKTYAAIEPTKPVRYCFSILLPIVAVRRPNDIKAVVSGEPEKSELTRKLLGWLGRTSILLTEGEQWRRMRTLLNPAFHRVLLKDYTQTMLYASEELVHKFEAFAEHPDETVEVGRHFYLLALDVVCRCAFSFESDCQRDPNEPLTLTISKLSEEVLRRMSNPLYLSDWIYYRSSIGREAKRKEDFIRSKVSEIIAQRRTELEDMTIDEVTRGHRPSGRALFDFLDICLLSRDENGKPALTEEDLLGQCTTFLGAGFDTTATALTFIAYCLAKHPEEQQKCREEIFEHLGPDTPPGFDDFAKLPFTVACIKECMRMYPPVPVISRTLDSPVTLECGEVLPAGTLVDVNILMLHHNPTVWDSPEEFRPERFLNKRVDPHSYMPFSVGSRNCIGGSFAMTEIRVVVCQLLRRFKLVYAGRDPVMGSSVTLKAMDGVHLKIQPVEGG